MRAGVISDTHGVLLPGVESAFRECALILHAGDVGSSDVLRTLGAIAPVTAVAGNMDAWGLAAVLEETARVRIGSAWVIVAHRLEDAMRAHRESPADVVVVGHTHVPRIERREGALVLNPGSASRPLAGSSPTVGILEIAARGITARIVEL